MNNHRTVRFSANHAEIAMAAAEQGDPDPIASFHGQSVQAASGMFDLVIMQGAAAQWRKRQTTGDRMDDLVDCDLLAERHAGIGAADAIELDDLLAPQLFECGHRFGDGCRAAFDLQHVAR